MPAALTHKNNLEFGWLYCSVHDKKFLSPSFVLCIIAAETIAWRSNIGTRMYSIAKYRSAQLGK